METFKTPKKGKYVKSKFMIYADFEGILVPEDNVKQKPDEFIPKKYQKHVACSYRYQFIVLLVVSSNKVNNR